MTIAKMLGAIVGLLAVVSLAACGGSGDATATIEPTATPPATVAPTATLPPATLTPTTSPVANDPTPTTDNGSSDGQLLALGKEVFDTTAGGLGCAYCHKADATGDALLGSPDIRDVTEGQIWDALDTRAQMTFITLTDEEVRAVAAYLATIGN